MLSAPLRAFCKSVTAYVETATSTQSFVSRKVVFERPNMAPERRKLEFLLSQTDPFCDDNESLVRTAEQATKKASLGLCGAGPSQQANHPGLRLAAFFIGSVKALAKVTYRAILIA